jgi:hypothetical protein
MPPTHTDAPNFHNFLTPSNEALRNEARKAKLNVKQFAY